VAGPDLQGLAFKSTRVLLNRRGKGVVRRMDLPAIHLKQREILNPTKRQFTFINEIQLISKMQAQGPEARLGYLPETGNNQHQVASRGPKGGSQTGNLLLAEELCHWRTKTIFGNGNPHKALGSSLSRYCRQLIKLFSAVARRAPDSEASHYTAAFQG